LSLETCWRPQAPAASRWRSPRSSRPPRVQGPQRIEQECVSKVPPTLSQPSAGAKTLSGPLLLVSRLSIPQCRTALNGGLEKTVKKEMVSRDKVSNATDHRGSSKPQDGTTRLVSASRHSLGVALKTRTSEFLLRRPRGIPFAQIAPVAPSGRFRYLGGRRP
jgi:hypothetical protein